MALGRPWHCAGVTFEPAVTLSRIVAATSDLVATAALFTDADVRQPSLLPGWSRGHVLTHVARNADGGSRMLTWARTGVETPEYPSLRARAEDIEAGHSRGAAALTADVRDSAERFATAYEAMPDQAWERPLRWTSGKVRPAYRAADARLTEVFVHHVDLRAGFGPGNWPSDFVSAMMTGVVSAYATREGVPGLHLIASDTGADYRLGARDNAVVIRRPQAALLAHLLGRSEGDSLPALPFLY